MILAFPKWIEFRAREVEEGKWELDYREGFDAVDKEAVDRAATATKTALEMARFTDFEIKLEDSSVGLKIKANKDAIFGMLAGEFLGNSPFGKLTVMEILALAMMKMARTMPDADKH